MRMTLLSGPRCHRRGQRLTAIWPSLEAPFQRAEDLVEAIRTRGERR
ncbi:MAG: hypothetical protein KKA73_20390 [Chloroflexi bacterium]|nr:hypothetical protein [Chloroflexota bacterium]